MNTKETKFKTNLNCGSCVEKVKPFLDKLDGVTAWEVDTANPNKILTVNGVDIDNEKVIDTIEEVGFNAEIIED